MCGGCVTTPFNSPFGDCLEVSNNILFKKKKEKLTHPYSLYSRAIGNNYRELFGELARLFVKDSNGRYCNLHQTIDSSERPEIPYMLPSELIVRYNALFNFPILFFPFTSSIEIYCFFFF